MVEHDKPVPAGHLANNPPPSGHFGALAVSLLDSLLHRRNHQQSPSNNSKVNPQLLSKYSRNSRSPSTSPQNKREERSRRDVAKSRREGHSGREGYSPPKPILSIRRSSSAKQLIAGLTSRKLRQSSVISRSYSAKVAVNNADKHEAPEVVTNYVYEVPEKKTKPKTPTADYDDIDNQEIDDFDLDDEEELEEELEFELRPFISDDEDEMAYFAHRMGGSDFKLHRRHVLHPHGRLRSTWDTITLLLTTWVLIIVPFELSFAMRDSLRRTILHLDLFVDSLFLVDIILNFNTAVEDDGKLHFSLSSIFRHYTRGWFVPELLWTIPFYAILEGHDPEAYTHGGSPTRFLFRFSAQAAWMYPAARGLRLLRVLGLPRLQGRLEHSLLISSKVSSLGSFLFVVLALSHVFSCVFAYLAFHDDDQLEFALSSRTLQDSEVKTRYIAAFYWSMMTMTTVGYGDITVKTNAGRLFSIAAMIVGAGVFAYGITNVVSLFQQLYESDTAYRRDMDQINDFMQDRMLPRALRDKVRANTFHWRKAARGENKERDRAIVERMAHLIRIKVADRFCEDMMPRKMPFLAGCSAEFIHDLYLRMRVQCYLPGEDIISQGDYGSEMYFLFVGHAQVLLGLTKVALFGPNSCFGEFSIANPRKPRLATIQALDFCETHCIDREQILRVLLSHPITMRSARQLATLRSRKALTLIYESGGKSRTLLQGLAMMWRAEGVEAVLPAGISPASLPFLQEFTAVPIVPSRRSSSIIQSSQLHRVHSQQHIESVPVVQRQKSFNSHSGHATPPTLSFRATNGTPGTSSGSARRASVVIDPTITLIATQGALASPVGMVTPPSSHRGRNGMVRLPKINAGESKQPDVPIEMKENTAAQEVVNGVADARPRPGLRRVASVNNGSPDAVAATPTAPPQDDRLELLLTEIRNVASRQNILEQQLKELLERQQTIPESLGRRVSLDSGVFAHERGRFDEQHWIDDHAPPIGRQRSSRHVLLQHTSKGTL
ncbi:hypothetical protein F442_08697 [Phytophthora nicotianae P10297]|uniref:Cyclic nucleotide-binding domain-containing protein n=2 Tax=Phytophthora nicotianae TaxID=4792 RepID=W2Q853_PHYN3|nr:hypothetical protein PPTG_11104 [Phytophthora nicotianae INRA-310]ETN09046.1 hypothetical protein PPTG_11104 [Phytophthora nicotianae INRA-310]ETP44765.1 hypothetical protein F442_08697 [Phytophthora nicotianae P10297]